MILRILILTPTSLPEVTGNAITAERWRRSLTKRGLDVRVIATQGSGKKDLLHRVGDFQPQIIHVHHAFRAGALVLDPRLASGLAGHPLVVSSAGTDINRDLSLRRRKDIVLRVFQRAKVLILQNRETVASLGMLLPGLRDRILYVPKAFSWMGEQAFDLRGIGGCGPENFIFFLPAGIRPVKGNLECLAIFEKIHSLRPRVRIIFAGPSLDSEYAARFEGEVKRLRKFARWIPLIPPEAMRSAYAGADVVLNTSFSEGLSNSIMEAIAAGRPLLASDIQGNRWPVLGEDGDLPSGYLFNPHEPADFIEKALRLIDDPKAREGFARASRKRGGRWPSPEAEANGLISAYSRVARRT